MPRRRTGESSFTLIETIIAMSLMVIIILQVTSVNGQAITFSAFGRRVTQASWFAKAIASHLEYKSKLYPLKDIRENVKEEKIPQEWCPRIPPFDCDFTYSLTVEEWKIPLIELAAKSMGDKSMAGMIKDQVKSFLGDELLKVADITVAWKEGSRKDYVKLAYLITGQFKLDETISSLPPVAGEEKKDDKDKDKDKPPPPP